MSIQSIELAKQGVMIETAKHTAILRVTGFDSTITLPAFIAPYNCSIIGIKLISDTATTSSESGKKFAFQIHNKTQNNDLCSTAQATYQSAAVNEIGALAVFDLAVNQNLDLLTNDYLQIEITETGAPTSLASASIFLVIEYKSNQVKD